MLVNNSIYVLHSRPALAVLSLTSHCMTSWWRWDLWRQMNFSLRDNKVVNRIENQSNGLEKLHLSSISMVKSDRECVSVSEEMKCLSRVTDLCTVAFHQWLAITLTSVKQILHPNWHPSAPWRQSNHEMPQTNVGLHSTAMSTSLTSLHSHTHKHTNCYKNISQGAECSFWPWKEYNLLAFKFSLCELWWWNGPIRFLDIMSLPSCTEKVFKVPKLFHWCNKDVLSTAYGDMPKPFLFLDVSADYNRWHRSICFKSSHSL